MIFSTAVANGGGLVACIAGMEDGRQALAFDNFTGGLRVTAG